jgi:hypothetical protein
MKYLVNSFYELPFLSATFAKSFLQEGMVDTDFVEW